MMIAPSAACGSDVNSGVERRLRQRREQRREEGDRQQDERGRDERGQRRPGTGRVVHGGAGESTRNRVAAEQPGRDVGDAQTDELAIGVDLVAVPPGADLGNRDRLHEADERDDDRGTRERRHDRGIHRGQVEAGEHVGDLADDLHAAVLQAQQLDREDRADDDDEGRRNAPGVATEREERGDRHETDGERGQVGVTQDEEDLPDVFVEVLGARHRHAQHVLDLREADDDGGGGGEADEHGVGQEVDDESQTPDTQHQVDRADE
jgi:hypothetical protein